MEKIRKITLGGFLIVICVLSLFIAELSATPSVFKAIKQTEEDAASVVPVEEYINRPVVVYKGSEFRDPFEAYAVEDETNKVKAENEAVFQAPEIQKPLPSFEVQGIIWGGSFPQAIINNKVVKEGDKIEDALIKEISKKGITLVFEGRVYKIPSSASRVGYDNKTLFPGGEHEKDF